MSNVIETLRKNLTTLIIVGLVCAIGMSLWAFLSIPKIAYVRIEYVIEKYVGTKEAAMLLQEKVNAYKGEVTVIDSTLEVMAGEYNALDKQRRDATEGEVKDKAGKLAARKEQIAAKIQELDRSMTDEMMTQIDEYIKEYAAEKGYDYILGVNQTGTLVYATESDDISEELLKYLNHKFKGK